ncbi:uncharacterized protein LOC108330120 [Vigna angularis]|uniref:uncharacterized protein LOC108330120 n=1 Tax=Phaseolus angularis TaxID=3914 RepID=UPI0022B36C3C|nr:uncharacterized protein LOC108330120 [Vigna angularis]
MVIFAFPQFSLDKHDPVFPFCNMSQMLTPYIDTHAAAMSTRNQFHSTFGEEPLCTIGFVSDYTSKRKWRQDGFDQTDPALYSRLSIDSPISLQPSSFPPVLIGTIFFVHHAKARETCFKPPQHRQAHGLRQRPGGRAVAASGSLGNCAYLACEEENTKRRRSAMTDEVYGNAFGHAEGAVATSGAKWGHTGNPIGLTLKPQSQSLTPLFSYPSHLSSIKTVIVSGSLPRFPPPKLCICHRPLLRRPSQSPLPRDRISTDAAGSITIFDVDGFIHLITLSVHCKSAINDLALHPSGERALTVALTTASSSSTLSAAVVNLDKEATLVKFNVTGDHFFVAAKEKGFVQQTEDARIFFELECSKPVLCAAPARVEVAKEIAFERIIQGGYKPLNFITRIWCNSMIPK